MEKKRSWLKTILLGILVGIAMASISIYIPPTETCYAGHHGGGNAGYAAGGAAAGMLVGACMADQMARDRAAAQPNTIIVTDPHAGQTYYNGVWYPSDRCYKVDKPVYDQAGNYLETISRIECQ